MNEAGYKKVFLITFLSLIACVIHAIVLHTPFNQYIYTSIIKIILFTLCPLVYFAIDKNNKIQELFSIDGIRKSIKYYLILGSIVFLFILIIFRVFQSLLDPEMIISTLSNIGISTHNYFIAFLYIIFINAALEELFFRGFIFLILYKMNYKYYAFIYSSLLFALYHVSVVRDSISPVLLILCIAGLFITGLIFNELTKRCGSIIGSLIVHASANLAINLIGAYILFS